MIKKIGYELGAVVPNFFSLGNFNRLKTLYMKIMKNKNFKLNILIGIIITVSIISMTIGLIVYINRWII